MKKKFIVLLLFLFSIKITLGIGNNQFKFITMSDTQSQPNILSELSDTINSNEYSFILYSGDLEQNGFTLNGIDQWKKGINSELTGDKQSNGLINKVFAVRGNHDEQYTTDWQSYFNHKTISDNVGASNYYARYEDLVYSFDYGNSHFIGLDYRQPTTSQITWLESDIINAEQRGLTHVFIFNHIPLYCSGNNHCSCESKTCDNTNDFIKNVTTIINKHSIITLYIGGHEHIETFTCIDSARVNKLSGFYRQLINSPSGASNPDTCNNKDRWDVCYSGYGYNIIEVNGEEITVKYYNKADGTIKQISSFNKYTPCNQCIPITEVCDNKDNNCDGNIDEGCNCVSGTTKECGTSIIGECKKGTQTCISGTWNDCVGNIEPTTETQDGKDNDCDNSIDEDFTVQSYCPNVWDANCFKELGLKKFIEFLIMFTEQLLSITKLLNGGY